MIMRKWIKNDNSFILIIDITSLEENFSLENFDYAIEIQKPRIPYDRLCLLFSVALTYESIYEQLLSST